MTHEAGGLALPGEECRVPPRDGWSDLERWVWQEIGSGRVADINKNFGRIADPKKPAEWRPERRLRPTFLETILLHDPWRSALPRQGVNIVGALFDARVDLVEADITQVLGLVRSRFTSNVHFQRMRTKSAVSLTGSVIAGALDMDSACIGGSLLMRAGAEFSEVILRAAQITGQLDLCSARVGGTLYMGAARVGSSLLMREGAQFAEIELRGAQIGSQIDLTDAKVAGTLEMDSVTVDALLMRGRAEFAEIVLRGAQVGSQLDLSNAKVTGVMNMDSVTVGDSIIMRGGAAFADVRLAGARIGGQLDLIGAKVTGALIMDSASVGRDLFMFNGQFSKPVNLVFARIGGNLDLRGATLAGLDLTGAQLGGELRLASGSTRPSWNEGARLILRNTRVAAVQDEPEAWPQSLSLEGFTYERFGGFGGDTDASTGSHGTKSFQKWLERHVPYSPQPYQRCAKVLREMGHPDMADGVLYAGRERDRKEALRSGNNPRATGLTLLKWTIGYGYGHRYFRSLWWVAGFVIFGTLMLLFNGQIDKVGGDLLAGAFYSLDLLLPIIQLYEPHYKVVLDGFAKYYFAFHKLMGYVLASFLIAGLAGLTK